MKSVVVFGSINMDVVTFCERHPHVGETIISKKVAFFPGGKGANQAVAAARCAGKSFLVGSVGDDGFGAQMLAHLKKNDVETKTIKTEPGSSTGVAIIVVDDKGENVVIVTPGANDLAKAPAQLAAVTSDSIVAIAQLEVPLAEIARFFQSVRNAGGVTILNPSPYRPLPQDLLQATSIMILNEHEFAELTGQPVSASPAETIASISSVELPVPCCIVTLGSEGFVLAQTGHAPIHVTGYKVAAVDTTGAGDCFAGWFAGELAQGNSFEQAGRRANMAASISVTRAGAGSSMPTRPEVDAFAGPDAGEAVVRFDKSISARP